MLGPEYALIESAIPSDHSKTSSAEGLLGEVLSMRPGQTVAFLDFGCGDGRGLDLAKALRPGISYHGVDIEGSPEVESRTRQDGDFRSYNGVDLPYGDESFDVVYSRQVFEHVRHPDLVVREIKRVLRPGGTFVGSLSNLEPYHSYSIFNYTPYGLYRLIDDNGLTLRVMRPGIEGTSLMIRQLSQRRLSRVQLVYPAVALGGKIAGWDAQRRNYLKLRFSGHICFIADRAEA